MTEEGAEISAEFTKGLPDDFPYAAPDGWVPPRQKKPRDGRQMKRRKMAKKSRRRNRE